MRQTGEIFDLGVTVGGAGLAGNVPATVSTAGLRAPVREMPEKDVRFVQSEQSAIWFSDHLWCADTHSH
ncbi:hypothetical protein [Rhizobium hidalgonense]|uniref:hypothetical protein n=1 Tax=Rhizobium hidalgonense TaxID=1538159 RepID=UPI001105A3BD|nr:hypothetical protein [Rhizobium hidalgonense]QKK26820.1 hypothetical protein FFM81_026265 [Rhizobium hidalgonense]